MAWKVLMSAVAGDTGSRVSAAVARRWETIDPLLPVPSRPAGCGREFAVPAPGGPPAAMGTCEHWAGTPGTLEMSWGAARRFRFTPLIAGADVTGGLDQLLSQWREHLAGLPEAAAEDTAAVVTWPSRDIDGVKALLRHGLAPLAVIAVRPAGRGGGPAVPPPAGLRIRRAGPADMDSVVRLGMETIRFDAHFGTVIERPDSAEALRREAAPLLAGPGAWTWLAERDGQPVGMLYAERPEFAGWIAPMVRPAPVAYVELMVVLPGQRGGGVGAALVAEFHRAAGEAGVAVTLLHHEQLNPLSGPFWSQQGYRPLWTSWEARPARVLR
jgi:GNAT superfamily N-acetyltransferase